MAAAETAARLPILQSLRDRGFRLAFNHTVLESAYASWLPVADYIKLDLTLLRPEQLAILINYANRNSHARIIAEKVETAQQFEQLKSMGVSVFQGFWFARPSVVEARLLAPSQSSIVHLINLLRQQARPEEIEEVLKKDAGLAFNLMRLINSAGFGVNREVTSFREAVMIMGMKKLFRWAALLLTASGTGHSRSSLGQTAVVRGRLMELLALEFLSEEDADQAFVVGLFSLLDAMLNIPMADALQLINVPAPVSDALRHRPSVLGELLALACACESSDDVAFDRSATALKLTNEQINMAHLQALAWTDHVDL